MFKNDKRINKKSTASRKNKKKKDENLPSILTSGICCAVTAIAMIAGLFIAEPMVQFDFNVGDIATENVTATRDIEDNFVTEQLIEKARSEIQEIYRSDSEKTADIYEKVLNGAKNVEYIFTEANAHFTQWKTEKAAQLSNPGELDPEWGENSTELAEYNRALQQYQTQEDYYDSLSYSDVIENETLFAEVFPNSFINQLNSAKGNMFTAEQAKLIISSSPIEIAIISNNLPEIVLSKLNSGIRENEVSETRYNIRNLVKALGLKNNLDGVIDVIITNVIHNEYYDEAQTEEARRIAAEAVEPIVYKKGQTIITAGQPITEAQYNLINELGMLTSGDNEYSNYISLSIIVLMICALHFFIFYTYKRTTMISMKNNIMISIIIVVSMYVYIFTKPVNEYICPSLLAVILIAMLVDGKAAVIVGAETSLYMGMYAGCDFSVMMSSLAACTFCACVVGKVSSSRSRIILVGLISASLELLVVGTMEYYMTAKLGMFLINAFWALLSGLASSILAIGLLSVFENLFNVVTPIRLLELSNQSQPLLKRLQLEATGTYYHSIMVGNMAETAANDIGADGILARIGAYYHDIGKLMHPSLFSENQIDGINEHDKYAPEESARGIISHVSDGIAIAESAHLSKIIYPFIEEHHGTTLASFFYYNACDLYGKENVNINDYRYRGRTPSTRESAILMLADTVEAATRSLKDKTPENLRNLINELVDAKINAGQLENCPITFKEISTIKQSFFRILSGVYHKRVEYPKMRDDNQTNQEMMTEDGKTE